MTLRAVLKLIDDNQSVRLAVNETGSVVGQCWMMNGVLCESLMDSRVVRICADGLGIVQIEVDWNE